MLTTIDKFARLAWVEDTKRLFCVEKVPPSLIIQDELHLISGALGSLAGLYEIAVDYLCRKDGISPKIIASTATVKNADEQIRNLYNKKMQQFPPSGILGFAKAEEALQICSCVFTQYLLLIKPCL